MSIKSFKFNGFSHLRSSERRELRGRALGLGFFKYAKGHIVMLEGGDFFTENTQRVRLIDAENLYEQGFEYFLSEIRNWLQSRQMPIPEFNQQIGTDGEYVIEIGGGPIQLLPSFNSSAKDRRGQLLVNCLDWLSAYYSKHGCHELLLLEYSGNDSMICSFDKPLVSCFSDSGVIQII